MRRSKKIRYLEGDGYWLLKGSRLRLSDGPHGVRKETPRGTMQATCFPTASALACSWNEKLVELVGESLATECIASDVNVLLGPGVNLQRHPACGRNFEYFGEDPLLSGKMAAAYIRGVQSKNVAATLKHFALNSQETDRFLSESIVDERALRELYLMPFEIAIRESNPWAVMTAYNRFEGLNAGENKRLLNILRYEWRYDGCVVSDWGSVENRVLGLEAGMDLEMPGGSSPSSGELKKAYRKGRLDEELVDRALSNIEKLEERAGAMKRSSRLGHYHIAVDVARECMVLLRNENELLPLSPTESVLLAGAIDEANIQGLGSSRVEPFVTNTPLRQWRDSDYPYVLETNREEVVESEKREQDDDRRYGAQISHVYGSSADEHERNCCTGVCLYFAKLPPDAEGYDRLTLELSPEDKLAIDSLKDAGHTIVLILQAGAPIVLGDVQADAILLMNYAGEGAYEALQSIIYGLDSPSGRLCATLIERRTDIASDPYYPSTDFLAQYRESIYVGYRYHTTFDMPVAYPFGYGLTYGEFNYEQIGAGLMAGNIFLTVRVSNTGKRKAKEVVQAYTSLPESSLLRPFCELKAWAKVELEPGESRDVVLKIPRERLKTYTTQGKKIFEEGVYYFLCGANCRDLSLIASLELLDNNGKGDRVISVAEDLTVEQLRQRHLAFSGIEKSANIPAIYRTMDRPVAQEEFEQLLGRSVPEAVALNGVNAPLYAIRGPLRPLFFKIALKRADAMPGDREMNRRAVLSMPLRALARLSEGLLSPRLLKLIVFLGLRGQYRAKRNAEAQKYV